MKPMDELPEAADKRLLLLISDGRRSRSPLPTALAACQSTRGVEVSE